jgi:hypothetical protein
VLKSALKGNIVRLKDEQHARYVLQLDRTAFPGSYAIVGSRSAPTSSIARCLAGRRRPICRAHSPSCLRSFKGWRFSMRSTRPAGLSRCSGTAARRRERILPSAYLEARAQRRCPSAHHYIDHRPPGSDRDR